MKIFYRAQWYLFKLFFKYFLALLLLFVLTLIFVEALDVKKHFPDLEFLQQLKVASLKTPLILGKLMPFLIFGTTLLLFFRLARYHEMTALFSAGFSVKSLLAGPLMMTFLIGIADLFIVTHLAQKCLDLYPKDTRPESFQMTKSQQDWLLYYDVKQKIIVNEPQNTGTFQAYFLTPNFYFLKKYVAASKKLQGNMLHLKDVWVVQKGLAPVFEKKLTLVHPKFTMRSFQPHKTHPSLIPFSQAIQNIFEGTYQKSMIYLRLQYLASNAFWLLTLVILGASLLLGTVHLSARIFWMSAGIVICFIVYVIREWLYAFSLSCAYIFPAFLFWIVPVVTLLFAFIILFEKREV